MQLRNLFKKMLLVTASLLLSVGMFAQRVDVRGTVTDEGGFPVIGASVMVSGTSQGVVTDLDGKYAITNVDPQATLQVSSIGFTTENVTRWLTLLAL